MEAAVRRQREPRPWQLPAPRDPRLGLKPAVLQHVAGLATLLRVLAGPGDVLWTPLPVDPERLPSLAGRPLPRLCSGRLPTDASALLLWAQTARSARLRAPPPEAAVNSGLAARLWSLPPSEPAVAQRANDRRRWLGWALQHGLALPGATVCRSRAQVCAALAEAESSGDWVLKAPFSAAGRARLRSSGPPQAATWQRIERLLHLYGSLVYEPWLQRHKDFGYLGWVEDGEVQLLGGHRLLVEPGGGFRGIALQRPGCEAELKAVARQVGSALAESGYQGPFGIDAFEHAGGLHPLVEVNARLSFGHLARVYAELFLQPALTLHCGTARSLTEAQPRVVLLRPAEGAAQACWLEW